MVEGTTTLLVRLRLEKQACYGAIASLSAPGKLLRDAVHLISQKSPFHTWSYELGQWLQRRQLARDYGWYYCSAISWNGPTAGRLSPVINP